MLNSKNIYILNHTKEITTECSSIILPYSMLIQSTTGSVRDVDFPDSIAISIIDTLTICMISHGNL